MNITNEVAVADIESKYRETIEERSDNDFFLKLADYGKYLQETKIVSLILKPLPEKAKEDLRNYDDKRDKFLKRWQELSNDILAEVDRQELEDVPAEFFTYQSNQLKERLNQLETSYFEEGLHYFFEPYRLLINKFRQIGKIALVKDKHLSEDGQTPLLFAEYNEALNEWEKFKRLRENTVWWAHYNIERLSCGVLNLEKIKNYFKRDSYIDDMYKYEFERFAVGEKPVFLKRNLFEMWFKRLHSFLISRLKIYRDPIDEIKSELKSPDIEAECKDDINISYSETKKPKEHATIGPAANKELVYGNLRVNIDQGVIHYGDNIPIEISPDNNIVKFLVILLQNGKIVEYTQIARKLEVNCWHEEVTNKDVAREVQSIKRDLTTFLRGKVGMPRKEIQEMIITKKNLGYKLCPISHPYTKNPLKTHKKIT